MPENTRRRLFTATVGAAAATAAVTFPRPAYAAANSSYQDVVKLGADPTGASDSCPAFVKAFNNLPANGGTIYVQSGTYLLDSPLSFTDKPLNLIGDGSAATVFLLNHTMWGVTFVCDYVGSESERYPFKMSGFSLVGVAASAASGAISASFWCV